MMSHCFHVLSNPSATSMLPKAHYAPEPSGASQPASAVHEQMQDSLPGTHDAAKTPYSVRIGRWWELGQSRKALCRKSKAKKQDLERECEDTLGSPEFTLQRVV